MEVRVQGLGLGPFGGPRGEAVFNERGTPVDGAEEGLQT